MARSEESGRVQPFGCEGARFMGGGVQPTAKPFGCNEASLFVDSHHHPSFYAALEGAVDLSGCADGAAALALLAARGEAARGEILLALGWNDGLFRFTEGALEPLPPTLVCNLSLHGFLANAAGRAELASRDAECAERLSEPAFVERNLPRIFGLLVDSSGVGPERLARFFARLSDLGVGAAEEMYLSGPAALAAYRDAGLLPRTRLWSTPRVFDALPPADRGCVAGLKFFADGALGARTAALARPFRDAGGTGILLHTDEELAALLAGAHERGLPAALHAIGDRALDQTSRVIGRLARDGALPALRVEHAQFVTEEVARRFRDHAVVLSMQPNFSEDSRHYLDRLPEGYAARNNPFRMLIDRVGYRPGIDLLFGSDGMPAGAAAALRSALHPPHPAQRLARGELLEGYRASGAAV